MLDFARNSDGALRHNLNGEWTATESDRERRIDPNVVQSIIPGSAATTATISAPGTRVSTLDFSTDTDWYRITLTAGQTYSFALTGTGATPLADPVLNLLNGAGVVVASDDDGGTGFNSFIASFTAPTTGTYFLDVQHFPGTALGGYELLASVTGGGGGGTDSIAGGASTGASIQIGGPAQQSLIDSIGDTDWFRVTLTAGQSYLFTLNGSGTTPLGDAYLELRDGAGGLIAFDDDAGVDTNSLLRFTAQTTGTYYLNARAFESETGGYTLTAATGPAQDPLDTIDLGFTLNTLNPTVYFATAGQVFGTYTATRAFTPTEISGVMSALSTFSAATNLTFVETSASAGATLVYVLASLEAGTLGEFVGGSAGGTLALNPSTTSWQAGLTTGGLAYTTVIHEMGHALGLAHPHDNSGNSEIMQGVISDFNSFGTFGLNQGVYTVMTYNDGFPGGGLPGLDTFGNEATPMALDLALLQERYGANATANSGDSTYTLPDANAVGATWRAIWDAGGVDTIVSTASVNATIDLRAATILSEVGGGGFVSQNAGIRGGVTIARGVVIENAVGGSGADTLIGNGVANALSGGDGADTLNGVQGADILSGGLGNDFLYGESSSDILLTGNALAVRRLYLATLDRGPDPAGWAGWIAQLDAGVPLATITTGFIQSPEFQAVYGALNNTQFVTLLYNNVLHRAPDTNGLNGWLNVLNTGGSRESVVNGFSQSVEFILGSDTAQHGGQVFRLYGATLDRAPDPTGFAGWTNALANNDTLDQIAAGFVNSVEFQTVYGALDNTQFVTLLYANVLNRAPDPAGLNGWLSVLAGGASRTSVVLGFSESGEFQTTTRAPYVAFASGNFAASNDTLNGGAGDDLLSGGVGADTFVFTAGHGGTDTIYGLETIDEVQLAGFGYTSAAQAQSHLTQVGSNLVFSDQGQTIVFANFTLSNFSDDIWGLG